MSGSKFPKDLYVIMDQRLSGTYLVPRPTLDAFEAEDEIAVYELKRVIPPVEEEKVDKES